MIQLANLLAVGSAEVPRGAGVTLATTSDFALALADLSASGGSVAAVVQPPGSDIALTAPGLPDRQAGATPGNILPDEPVVAEDDGALPIDLIATPTPAIVVTTPVLAHMLPGKPSRVIPVDTTEDTAVPLLSDLPQRDPALQTVPAVIEDEVADAAPGPRPARLRAVAELPVDQIAVPPFQPITPLQDSSLATSAPTVRSASLTATGAMPAERGAIVVALPAAPAATAAAADTPEIQRQPQITDGPTVATREGPKPQSDGSPVTARPVLDGPAAPEIAAATSKSPRLRSAARTGPAPMSPLDSVSFPTATDPRLKPRQSITPGLTTSPIVPTRPDVSSIEVALATLDVSTPGERPSPTPKPERIVSVMPAIEPKPALRPEQVRSALPTLQTPVAKAATDTPAPSATAPAPVALEPLVPAATASLSPIAVASPTPAATSIAAPVPVIVSAPTVRGEPATAPAPLHRVAPPPASVVAPPPAAAFTAAMLAAANAPRADREERPASPLTVTGIETLAATASTAQPIVHAAAASVQPTLDLTRHDWMNTMIERIETLQTDGARETRIRLSPDALGNIDVTIRHDDAGVAVRLTADTPQARAILADAAPRLTDMAEARGLKLAHAGVEAGTGQQQQRDARQPDAPTPTRPVPVAVANDDDAAPDHTDTRIA